MSIKNALASLAVRDLDAAVAWYERLLGTPSSRPMPEVAEWSFERGGWLQIYEDAGRAGAGSCTLAVSDLATEVTRLESMSIDTSHQTSSERVSTLMFTDPDGNHIAFAEAFDPKMAH